MNYYVLSRRLRRRFSGNSIMTPGPQGKATLSYTGLILVLMAVIGSSFAAHIERNDLESNDRIVGGRKSLNHDKPYMVLITFLVPNNGSLVFAICGGNVLSEWWIVTAAHCKSPGSTNYTLHLGMNTWCKDGQYYFSDGHEQRNIDQFIQHPEYENFLANDIALIRMDRPVKLGGNIEPVLLPVSLPKTGSFMTVAGWGQNTEDNPTLKCDLMEVDVKVSPREQCLQFIGEDTTHFCAGIDKGGKDSCVGDSGGGLVSKSSRFYVLNGLVSFGEGCGRPDSPGVYTKVIHFVSWIQNTLYPR